MNEELEKKRILIVEDDKFNSDVMNRMLTQKYFVEMANTGEVAINKIMENQFDIILLDINLGKGVTGLQVFQKVKTLINYKNIPIIAVTAFALNGEEYRFTNFGFDGYLAKPFYKEELFALLKRYLNKHEVVL